MAYSTQQMQGEELNRLYEMDLPVHDWYRFVLSFPPHLVRNYIKRFSVSPDQRILDPFCGTGTTLVEAKKQGIPSVGIEANPIVHFAASVKTDWSVDPKGLKSHAETIAKEIDAILAAQGLTEFGPLFTVLDSKPLKLKALSPEQERLVIRDSISPLPLHKTLTLIEILRNRSESHFRQYELLALAKEIVWSIGNLRFGPEVGVGKIKEDAPVVSIWREGVLGMVRDLESVRELAGTPTRVHFGDARQMGTLIEPASIDAVITSPPYPNEKDYSRTTRLESVLLGFTTSQGDLRHQKQRFVRSNTRTVYKNDSDDEWVAHFPSVQKLADEIENRRVALQKTSGFEKLYARVVRLYFGGMTRHLEQLKPLLRPGAKLAYVVGDQASYFQIMIRTGQILAEIAESIGYRVLDIDLFRSRFSTATQEYLREEVVLLQWNGSKD